MPENDSNLTDAWPCPLLRQLPVPMVIVDWDLRVLEGNDLFWADLCASQASEPGTPLQEALPQELFAAVEGPLAHVRETLEPTTVAGVRLYTIGEPPQVFDLRIVPGEVGGQRLIMIASAAVLDAVHRVEELTLLHEMVRVLRRETDLDRVLFTTLTCATAAGGLAFNRAFAFLIDASGEWLEGRMGLGPASAEEAHTIWTEISTHPRSLDEFAAAYDRWAEADNRELQDLVCNLRFSMKRDAEQLPVLAALQRTAVMVEDAEHDDRVSAELCELLGVREFVAAPMSVADEARGVIMADNLYSGKPITAGDLRLLSLFGQHAGMAIESAQTYHEMKARGQELETAYARLKETQAELVRAEKLAVLGDMAARVAHDFRNPIVTIGGWARYLEEVPEDTEAVRRAVGVIAEEATNLETILAMLVEPLASREVQLQRTDLNALMRDAVAAQQPMFAEEDIEVEVDLDDELPPVDADPAQTRRAVVNLLDNAVSAMPDGGKLSLRTRRDGDEVLVQVADTGVGMSEETSAQVFNPFFSTNHYGSGLGLTIVWDIVQSHGWRIDVASEPGEGTTFTVRIPLE